MSRLLDRAEEILIASLIAAATLLIFASVTHRYALGLTADLVGYTKSHGWAELSASVKAFYFSLRGVNLVWAQELTIIFFVWMAKFGAAYGVRTGIHVGIDVLINRLPEAQRKGFILFGLLAGATFTAIIALLGTNFVAHMAQASATSPDLELPMWLVYLAIPLGSSLMCFRFLQVAWVFHRTGELPHHDHGHVDGVDDSADPDAAEAFGAAVRASDLSPRDLSEPPAAPRDPSGKDL